MAVTLTKVGKTPGQTQFGLDTFTERYKCDATADIVLTDGSVPQKGSVHPSYAFMFLTDRYCTETGESASALDLVYTGCLQSSGGLPVLPPQQHEKDQAIESASSSTGSNVIILKSPLTIQYYAPSNVLTYFSYLGPGTDVAVDPSESPVLISIVCGDTTFTPSSIIANLVNGYFSLLTKASFSSPEVVAGKFWQNTSRKTKGYIPFMFNLTAGAYININAPGLGYTVGDTLTISAGGQSAVLVVNALGSGGSVNGFTISSNTFTAAHTISATGGTGSGAIFNVFIIS